MKIFLALLAATATSVPVPSDIPEPNPSQMSRVQIREHNAKLPKDHPYFIRCVRSSEVGSLVARRQICRTNQSWAEHDRVGETQARQFGDEAVARSASSSSN